MKNIEKKITKIKYFEAKNLTHKINRLEIQFSDKDVSRIHKELVSENIDKDLFQAAMGIKSVAGQINVIIHAVGILLSLPYILNKDELVEDLSLGAGNTGRDFDLETSKRIAEYKFIQWRGGSETIRQNQLFKDFYNLAEYKTSKIKYLYVLGTETPIKFLSGNREISSVCSRNNKLWEAFQKNIVIILKLYTNITI